MNIVIKARDEASRVLKKMEGNVSSFNDKVKRLQPTFKKMALFGTAAFAGIAAGAASAIKVAAKAEGSYNKFNTVFAEGAEDMLKFVKDIRKEMPSATHEIVRMAADLQDLLIPMGVTREKGAEMTKGFLDLANKVAAFNDVDPSEVLEAIKSGLAGSSEPLRRFGINALESSLELKAMAEGLLEAGQSFKDLDPEVKNAVRAEALLLQAVDNSADAISGFEENNDSLIRRQQELAATTEEISKAIGDTLAPILDDVVKKILPVALSMKKWAEDNPKLVKIIIIAAVALAALVAVIGLIGLALPSIIAGFALLTAPVLAVIGIIAGLIILGIGLIKNWDKIKAASEALDLSVIKSWNRIKEGASVIWDFIGKTISSAIMKIIQSWNRIKEGADIVWDFIREKISSVVKRITDIFDVFAIVGAVVWTTLERVISATVDSIIGKLKPLVAFFKNLADNIWERLRLNGIMAWTALKDNISATIDFIIGKLKPFVAFFEDIADNIWERLRLNGITAWTSLKDNISSAIDFITKKMEPFVSFLQNIIDKWNTLKGITFGSVIGKAAELLSAPVSALSSAFFNREHGGIVPGPAGRAIPIIAHGQERIIPATRSGEDGGREPMILNFNFNDAVVGEEGIKKVIESTIAQLNRDSTLSVVAGA